MQIVSGDGSPRRFVEYDGYQVQYLPESGDDGLVAFHFVAKRSYEIRPDKMAQATVPQRAINLSDVYYDDEDPIGSALRYETDLMPPKPACDVVVNGHCYPPGGEAVQCVCSLKVGKHPQKSVRVIGDRAAWLAAGQKTAQISSARPFSVKALRWEFAYGGVDYHHPQAPIAYPCNPVGMGFWAQSDETYDGPVDRYGPLPNLESPDQTLRLDALTVNVFDVKSLPLPAGFGWVPKHWVPRALKAGVPPSTAKAWKKMTGKFPGDEGTVPKLDPVFYQGAPRGQVIPYPNGGETVVLENMHPAHAELRFRLPADAPKLRWNCGFGFDSVKLNLDTIQIEPDAMALDLVWRGTCPAPEGSALETLKTAVIEVDGQMVLPAPLLDTGFPIELLAEGQP